MRKIKLVIITGSILAVVSQVTPGWGIEVNKNLSFEGTFTGVYQWMDGSSIDSKNRGSGAVDLGLSYKLTENDEFYLLGSFASGNALNDVSPFVLAPYADDLEEDLKNINGHKQQDNILEAWYAHTFNLQNDISLKLTMGIIDATCYIDDNRFANDEVSQFMNDVFVNTPLTTPPSYDLGAVIELNKGPLSAKLLGMTTKDGEEGPFYQYYALQLGYTLNSKLGEGNYRIFGFTTSSDFPNWGGTDKEKLYGIGLSIDQDLGLFNNPLSKNPVGIFLRAGWQDDSAKVVNYNRLFSFGFNIPFNFRGKEENEIGIGYAYLNSPEKADLSNTHAVEAYAKFALFSEENLASDITLDFQYMKDNYANDNNDKEGYIVGVRWNLSF